MENKQIHILLADDDTANSLLLKRYLEVEGFLVAYAKDGAEALELYGKSRPDLVLLDVNMPRVDGFDVARQIRLSDNDTILFFLTDRTEKTDRIKGFSLRGNDYIPKPFYPEELVMRIKERFASIANAPQRFYEFGGCRLDTSLSTIACGTEKVSLSTRQSQILEILATHLGDAVSREEILTRVWGDDSYANSLALNVQITYLRRILSIDPSLEIIAIKKCGYTLSARK